MALVKFSQKRPGQLAARLLRKMIELSNRGSASMDGSLAGLPTSAATHYLLAMMIPRFTKMPMRSLRELRTLATQQKMTRAADVVAQRFKAVERALLDDNWARAQYAELIPLEHAALMSKGEEFMLQKEQEIEARLRPRPWALRASASGGDWTRPCNSEWPQHQQQHPTSRKDPHKGRGKGWRPNKGGRLQAPPAAAEAPSG